MSLEKVQKKIFILDTNVLIHEPQALFSFNNSEVGIPLTVLEELDQFKGETSARGKNARETIRLLDILRQKGSLADGVQLDHGGVLRIIRCPDPASLSLRLSTSVPDHNILLTAFFMFEQGYEVVFISKDLNMRVKAEALKIKSEDYISEAAEKNILPYGWVRAQVPASELQSSSPSILNEIQAEHNFSINDYVLLESRNNPDNYRLYRYYGSKHFKPVEHPILQWPIEARNPQQLMAMDLLFDDSIQLVNLIGGAGTGKTFLALVAALHKILVEDAYEKLLVSRPVIPLGADIGFLPGDLQEKLHSWMQPVRDNMEFIIHKVNSRYEHGIYRDQETYGRRKPRYKPKKRGEFHGMPPLEQLINSEKVSLEAITYMRGRSIPYQFIIIDEVQNLTLHEVKTLVSRVGEGSKIILAGDPYQIDSPYLDFKSNGLVVSTQRFHGQAIFGTSYLEKSERSLLSQLAAELL